MCVAVDTGAEAVDDGSGGGVVHDLSAVVEVVKVVTTIKAPKTKDVVQDQVLWRNRESQSIHTHTQTRRWTHIHTPRQLSSSLTRCSSAVFLAVVLLDSLEAWRQSLC